MKFKGKNKKENKDDKINNLHINKKNEKNLNNNFEKKKNINTFSFENLFCINKNKNKLNQHKKEEEIKKNEEENNNKKKEEINKEEKKIKNNNITIIKIIHLT